MTAAVAPVVVSQSCLHAAALERRVFVSVFAPRERMSHREWAEARRWLSPEANALAAEAKAPVRFSLDATPYMREVYDAISDPETEIVACEFPSQDGKTEIVNNFIGRAIDVDPGPLLVLQPTVELGEAWSKDRLAPMLRDCKSLRGKVRDARSRDADNTILHKKFPGGHLTIVGSNSPAGLSARPIRDVLVDEVDRCAPSAGTEGDPIRLAFRRAVTFKGKKLLISSPTILGASRIHNEVELGTVEECEVPCPDCGAYQPLVWGAKLTYGVKWDNGDPETAHYVCRDCGSVIPDSKRAWMADRYRWVAQHPERGKVRRTFRKNALISKLVSWKKQVREWLEIQGKITELQTFINTVLCELFDPSAGKTVKLAGLLDRRGLGYPDTDEEVPAAPSIAPDAIAFLTRSVDTQDNRVETAVWGWGEGEESWLIDWQLLPGDPALPASHPESPWSALDRERAKEYKTESGAVLTPIITLVDSGGHHTKEVYAYTGSRQFQRVFAIKGMSSEGAPLFQKPNKSNKVPVLLVPVGSFTGKASLLGRLARVTKPGPGYIHLPAWLDAEQVTQFTRLRLVTPVNKGGGGRSKWAKVKRAWEETGPVEQAILYVYASAGLQSIGALNLKNLGAIAEQQAESARLEREKKPEEKPDTDPDPPRPIRKKRGGWVTGDGQWG